MGSAVHSAAEAWEKSGRVMAPEDVRQVFRDTYKAKTDEMLEETPNTKYWQWSGRYNGEEDIPRRFKIGLEHVDRYLGWYEKHPEEVIWMTPDGTPAIELGFNLDLGGVEVQGMLDQAVKRYWPGRETFTVVARDIKTGNKPGKVEQLSLAGVAITEADPSIVPGKGDFLMTKSGNPTYPYDLINVDVLTEKFVTMDAGVRAGDFPASPEDDKCRRCDVADSCRFKA
jgi:putative RecB family exonuclease